MVREQSRREEGEIRAGWELGVRLRKERVRKERRGQDKDGGQEAYCRRGRSRAAREEVGRTLSLLLKEVFLLTLPCEALSVSV